MNLPNSNKSGVYVITNVLNGKQYVGSAERSLRKRASAHKTDLNRNCHCNIHLQAAWNKYGSEAFEFSVIEECAVELCIPLEQFWMDVLDTYKNGYNRCPKAGNRTGFRYSEESRKKMSEARKNMKRDPEVLARTIAAMTAATKGKKLSDEHRAKIKAKHWSKSPKAKEIIARISEKNSKYSPSPEMRARISATLKGRKPGSQALENMRAAAAKRAGIPLSEAVKAKMKMAVRNITEEGRAKMSAAAKKQWEDYRSSASEEDRARLSAGQKKRFAREKQQKQQQQQQQS